MLLTVPHLQQRNSADCLAACAAMVLAYYGLRVDYVKLISLLDIGPIGAPRRHVSRLSQLGVVVDYGEATLSHLEKTLQAGRPLIAFVDTGELPYWKVATNHAVVLVGVDSNEFLVNDPAMTAAPIPVQMDEFELAWFNADSMCAVLSLP